MKHLLFAAIAILLTTTAGGPDDRKAVAVLYFDNNSGDEKYAHLGKGLADMIITDLSSIPSIQLVERERLQDLIEELELQQTAYFDSTTALQIGKFVGAEYVVIGALTALEPTLRLDARVVSVESSEVVKTAEAHGREDRFFEIHEALVDELIDGLEIALSPEERERFRAQQEANRINELETALAYSEALDRFDQEDYVGALERMHDVMAAAPGSVIVRLTYERMKNRAAEAGKEKVREKANRLLKKIF